MLRFSLSLLAAALLITPTLGQDSVVYRLLKLDGRVVKWGEPSYGAGSVVTYALLAEPRYFDDARNCRAMEPIDSVIASSAFEKAEFESALEQAFAMWQSASGVRFTQSSDPDSADILIGADLDRRGWAYADVLASAATEGDIRTIERSLICFNPEQPWKIGFGDNHGAHDIRYTLSHEIGHAIGLNHASPRGQIMSFTYGEDFADLQPGDISGVQALYGPPAFANDNFADLGDTRLP